MRSHITREIQSNAKHIKVKYTVGNNEQNRKKNIIYKCQDDEDMDRRKNKPVKRFSSTNLLNSNEF